MKAYEEQSFINNANSDRILNKRISNVSEAFASFAIFGLSYFGVVGLRKIFQKYQIGQKCKKKFQKIRRRFRRKRGLNVRCGGGNFEDEILHHLNLLRKIF